MNYTDEISLSRCTGVQGRRWKLRKCQWPKHALANRSSSPSASSSPSSSSFAPANALAGAAKHDGTLTRGPEIGTTAHATRAIRGHSWSGLRGVWPEDIRQVLSSGGRQEVARRVSSVLALSSGSRRGKHLLQQRRKYLLQEGLLSVSELLVSIYLATKVLA